MDTKAYQYSIRDMTPLVFEESGGGSESAGDSDFSIANVTFLWKDIGSSDTSSFDIAGPFLGTANNYDAAISMINLEAAETTVQVILYKGLAEIEFLTSGSAVDEEETTGGVEYANGIFNITGDATIAFEDSGSSIEQPPSSGNYS